MVRLRKVNTSRVFALCIVLFFWLNYSALAIQKTVRQFWGHTKGTELNLGYPGIGTFLKCPLCDSSVYTYCSNKVEHDACCCFIPGHQFHPTQCTIYNCSLLYAKSCFEHALIKNCCCENSY